MSPDLARPARVTRWISMARPRAVTLRTCNRIGASVRAGQFEERSVHYDRPSDSPNQWKEVPPTPPCSAREVTASFVSERVIRRDSGDRSSRPRCATLPNPRSNGRALRDERAVAGDESYEKQTRAGVGTKQVDAAADAGWGLQLVSKTWRLEGRSGVPALFPKTSRRRRNRRRRSLSALLQA